MSNIPELDEGGARPLDRFWSKVDRKTESECWPWTGWTNSHGYGRVSVDGREVRATHIVLALTGRPLADGEWALHKCDNPICVNPDHLFAGSHADNVADRLAKGRRLMRAGNKNPRAVLTEDDVRAIRGSPETSTALAKKLGVTLSAISDIRRGKTWKTL